MATKKTAKKTAKKKAVAKEYVPVVDHKVELEECIRKGMHLYPECRDQALYHLDCL